MPRNIGREAKSLTGSPDSVGRWLDNDDVKMTDIPNVLILARWWVCDTQVERDIIYCMHGNSMTVFW